MRPNFLDELIADAKRVGDSQALRNLEQSKRIYEEIPEPLKFIPRKGRKRPEFGEIVQISNGRVIGRFKTHQEAAESMNISRQAITSALNGYLGHNRAGGYEWKRL